MSFDTLLDQVLQEEPQPQAPIAPTSRTPVQPAVDPFTGLLDQAIGPEPEGVTAADVGGEFVRAIPRGLVSVGTATLGAAGVVSKLVGEEQSAADLFDLSFALEEAAQKEFPSRRMDFDTLLDEGGIGDFAVFAASALGEQVPVIASVIASGGAGAGVGSVVGRLVAEKKLSQEEAPSQERLQGRRRLKRALPGSSKLLRLVKHGPAQRSLRERLRARLRLSCRSRLLEDLGSHRTRRGD